MSKLPGPFGRHLKPGRTASNPVIQAPPSTKEARRVFDEALRRAKELRDLGELKQAENICVSVLNRDPGNVQALLLAGSLARMADDIALALAFFKKAALCEPQSPHNQLMLALVYEEAREFDFAIDHFQTALKIAPGMVAAARGLGRVYRGTGQVDRALDLLKETVEAQPKSATLRLDYANALISSGRMEDAAAILRENIADNTLVAASYFVLSQTQKFSSEPPELSAIIELLQRSDVTIGDKSVLHQTAGKILDDLGRYDEAIDQIEASKINPEGAAKETENFGKHVDKLIAAFTPEVFRTKAGFGSPSSVPVFIVGMPRSGTTLTEQICASHPAVFGAGELSKLADVITSAGYGITPDGKIRKHPQNLTRDEAGSLADKYLEFLRKHDREALRIVDKMPHNFRHVGMIALLFPNAKIIHCTRDAIDNCISCYFQPFTEKHKYTNELRSLGLYYREYDRLMKHWNEVLPGRIYECNYETMIADQEVESRKLIDFLGLPWDDACLRYHETSRSVMTISRWQVRQPIYKSSVKRWKKYGDKIQPLIEALGDLANTE